MKLILTQEVSGLGTPGDVVEVKDGYARNYLMPRSLAVAWTKGGEKQVEAIRKARSSREIKSLEEAQQVRAALEGATVTLPAKAGANGRLFGAVTTADLAKVQRRRGPATRVTQGMQQLMHDNAVGPALRGQIDLSKRTPLPLRLLNRFPKLGLIPGYLVAIGFRPEHAPDFARR